MNLILLFAVSLIVPVLLIFFSGPRTKGYMAMAGVVAMAVISSKAAVLALMGSDTRFLLEGSVVTGAIPVVMDPLAAWFVLVINFTFITSVVYGTRYVQGSNAGTAALSFHWISYLFTHAGILAVCVLQNTVAFLVAWEIMALGTFSLIIFESNKSKTIRAGLNYLVQSHVAMLLITLAFIWVADQTGSYTFDSITRFARMQDSGYSLALMLIFFMGFGIKAGFVPFHTWLPLAHPAAPSHISGMMSGVLIKIGIYGILRMILLLNTNYLATGYFILTVSVITGIYGVMLAIIQHDLKRLLAYHSIENIGIIGIGIGLGCIGAGTGNPLMAVLGFTGALLHTLNHSLFKSLLFFGAGNISKAYHTMSIDRFGGVIRKMPHTALLFLVAALAICGLPPFNGFVSEFIIFSTLFKGVLLSGFPSVLLFVFGLFGLSLIGGLAILCFTKAFGTIFLGVPRYGNDQVINESGWQALLPMYAAGILIAVIGVFPMPFITALSMPVAQLTSHLKDPAIAAAGESFSVINQIGLYSSGFILLSALVFWIRKKAQSSVPDATQPTWGCGYVSPNARMQYSASSFVRGYRKLAEPMLAVVKNKKDVSGLFPGHATHETHPGDKTEQFLIYRPLRKLRHVMGLFSFLQNGRLQFYIVYGMIFIMVLVAIPIIDYLVELFTTLFKTL
jgi:hydrogenase-4 component B